MTLHFLASTHGSKSGTLRCMNPLWMVVSGRSIASGPVGDGALLCLLIFPFPTHQRLPQHELGASCAPGGRGLERLACLCCLAVLVNADPVSHRLRGFATSNPRGARLRYLHVHGGCGAAVAYSGHYFGPSCGAQHEGRSVSCEDRTNSSVLRNTRPPSLHSQQSSRLFRLSPSNCSVCERGGAFREPFSVPADRCDPFDERPGFVAEPSVEEPWARCPPCTGP